jgi:hypothetical protein
MKRIILAGLAAGFCINLCDVTVTVFFAADEWTQVLLKQGLQPSPLTPPYYVSASFLAGIILVWVYSIFQQTLGKGTATALKCSLLLWGVSRLYGAGHVVMGQMPLHIFAIMSSGLLLGFVVAGVVGSRLFERIGEH